MSAGPKIKSGKLVGKRALQRLEIYSRLDRLDDPAMVFRNAAAIVPTCYKAGLFDMMFSKTRLPIARAEWDADFVMSLATSQVIKDYFLDRPLEELAPIFCDGFADYAAQNLVSPKGVLVLAGRVSFPYLLIRSFDHFVPEGVLIGCPPAYRGEHLELSDPRAVLFNALRALNEGRTVFIAPDGTYGGRFHDIEVLGMTCTISEGAAFLAYETGCDTVWYGLTRDDAGFSPMAVPGPRRAPGETYLQFRDRLGDFYGRCVTEVLTGDPRNMTVGGRWIRMLSAAAA
jgi:hypothetical protein